MPPPPIPPDHPPADPRESTTTAAPPRSPALPSLRKKPSAGILTTTTSASGVRTTRITTTAAPSSTSASSPAAPLSRHPFKKRDQNATSSARGMRAGLDPKAPAPTTARQTTPRMPSYERPGPTGTRQPQMPAVARTANSSSKPPLTPKVATRPTTSASTTPLPRRPRPDTVLGANGSAPRDKLDITSPVTAFLNSNNVTPRSGSRQSRVESAHSTPLGTPNLERHDAWDSKSGLGISTAVADDTASRRPVVTFSPASDVSGAGNRQDVDSKFFYAADLPRQTQPPHTRPLAPQPSRNTPFFHANGGPLPDRSSAISPLTSPPASTIESHGSKFFYANGAPELQPAPKIGPSKRGPSSVVSTASRIPAARPGNALRSTSPVGLPAQPRSKSGHSTPLVSPRSPISGSHHRLSVGSQGRPGLDQSTHSTGTERGHARPKSLTMADAPAIARLISSHPSTTPSSEATSPLFAPPSSILPGSPGMGGFASLLQAAEDFAESEEGKSESLNSPAKSNSQEKEPISDLVANARRERKVQDLQITNASLEAINRTLERQLRKQSAELRRYKRMSRMSMASLSSRVPSASIAEGGVLAKAEIGLVDVDEDDIELAEEDAELEGLEEENEDEEDSMSGSDHSESGSSEHNESRRKRDENRLQVDLSKHQQLLVDSQKMNHSLKRCLGWTEELIKEGKRALAYKVTAGDVELGGRVLRPEELEVPGRREELDGSAMEGDVDDDEDPLKDDSLYGEDARLDDLGGTDAETDDLKDDSLYGDNPRLDDNLSDDPLRDDSLYGDILRSDRSDDLREDSLYGDNPRLDDDLRDDSLYGDDPRVDDDLSNTDTENDDDRRRTWKPRPRDKDSGVELPTDSR
ncbi:hypothetical protein QBC40DRAFT_197871 [Triangularia verruculosa]|uniref:Uncharacterized protein n=1 Tax=Triangularia verruculosa TaxID=2587418 RepID=A0AAN6XJ39_9PEZI|nr:hypothetical protein QBC40DRAFT_197871 [Triangularia verruculosa]